LLLGCFWGWGQAGKQLKFTTQNPNNTIKLKLPFAFVTFRLPFLLLAGLTTRSKSGCMQGFGPRGQAGKQLKFTGQNPNNTIKLKFPFAFVTFRLPFLLLAGLNPKKNAHEKDHAVQNLAYSRFWGWVKPASSSNLRPKTPKMKKFMTYNHGIKIIFGP